MSRSRSRSSKRPRDRARPPSIKLRVSTRGGPSSCRSRNLELHGSEAKTQKLAHLRHHRIPQRHQLTCPAGKPINHSTHLGFRKPEAGLVLLTTSNQSVVCRLPSKREISRRAAATLHVKLLLAVGVGHDEESIAWMRGANGTRWNTIPLRIVPARGKVPKDLREPPDAVIRHILQEHEARSNSPNDPKHLRPQVPPITHPPLRTSPRKRLTRIRRHQQIKHPELMTPKLPHVHPPRHPRPRPPQPPPLEPIHLHLTHTRMPRPLQTKIKTTHPRKQRHEPKTSRHTQTYHQSRHGTPSS